MSMKEKMARAMCKAKGYGPDTIWRDHVPTHIGDGRTVQQEISYPWWQKYLLEADAALDALMEPTEGMIDAGYAEHPDGYMNKETWCAMIRAIKDGK